jgi:hypothetical protein
VSGEDITNNSIEDLNDVAAMTKSYGDLFGWNGASWTNLATSTLNISLANTTGTLPGNRGGTGLSSIVQNQLLIGGAGDTWTQIATSTLGLYFSNLQGQATDAQIPDALTISGGTIENTPIGTLTPSTAVFTNATATNATTTNLFATNLINTNGTSTNLFVSNFNGTNATTSIFNTAALTLGSGTTTNFAISGGLTFNGVTGSAWSNFCTAITGGAGLCDGVDATGGASFGQTFELIAGALRPTTTVGLIVPHNSPSPPSPTHSSRRMVLGE